MATRTPFPRRTARAALAAAAVGAAILQAAAPSHAAPAPATPLSLEGCHFTLYLFKDSAARLRNYVPARYEISGHSDLSLPAPPPQQGTATIAAWAFACDTVTVGDGPPQPAAFTLLSVVVDDPDETTQGFEFPAFADHYLLWAHSDNRRVVRALRRFGMPAHFVREISFTRIIASVGVHVEVPWHESPFSLSTTAVGQDVFHPHDNSFWYDSAEGTSELGFRAELARDQFCTPGPLPVASVCGGASAREGTVIAQFLGSTSRSADFTFDHDKQAQATALLRSIGKE